jgi:kynurenine formamidase
MPRLLVHETGVHLIDVFRFLGGELDWAWGDLRRLNEVIAGEDAGLLTFRFESGALAVWDANRCNESTAADPRYTFGEFLIEGSGGSIRLYPDGRLTVQKLGQKEVEHSYEHSHRGFGGDCVFATQRHFIDCLKTSQPFETGGDEYLRNLQAVEAVYEAARTGSRVSLPLPLGEGRGEGRRNAEFRMQNAESSDGLLNSEFCILNSSTLSLALSQRERGPSRRIVDLSLPIDDRLPGAKVESFKQLEIDGWNATNITLYSHCGTHMDAPRHFVPGGSSLERMDLRAMVGPARVLDLTPIAPREPIGVSHLQRWHNTIRPGDRLLLRTDWHRRFGTPAYRNELPRIAPELATWLVERRVALLGVEPPSVADVNSLEELTVVHRILLGGNVVIVEGLAYLDQLRSELVEFVALPLRIVRGDGCPVRAIAIESD